MNKKFRKGRIKLVVSAGLKGMEMKKGKGDAYHSHAS